MKKGLLLFFTSLFVIASNCFAQNFTIRGKIMGEDQPLSGVSVMVRGTKVGTVTTATGEFTLTASSNAVLVLSHSAYNTKEVPVNGRTFIAETLEVNSKQLSDVIVVGYGVQRKVTTTGAITSVSGSELTKAPVAGISNALVGLTSGISAVQSSGEFGSDKAEIYVRGIATLNAGGRSPLILVDGVERPTYNNIDPNEVETINFLKDASSTAVFGVRGANGVILITTKQGKVSAPKVSFTSNLALLEPSVLPDYVNAYDYAVLRNEAQLNQGETPNFTEEDLRLYQTGEDPIFHSDIDWINTLIKPFSLQQSYNLNVSGGTDKVRYFTSLGYFNQSGGYHQPEQDFGFPYKHSYDRYNIRMNFDFNFTKDFSMAVKLGEQITDNTYPNGGAWGAFDKASTTAPIVGPSFVDGKYIENIRGLPRDVRFLNPWGQAGPTSTGGAFISDQFANVLNTNISLRYKLDRLTRGLSARLMGAYDSYYMKNGQRSKLFDAYTVMKDPANPESYILYKSSETGGFSSSSDAVNSRWRKMYAEGGFEYQRSIGNHRVGGLVLGNLQKTYDPGLQYQLPTGYLGLVSRVTYDYKSRYMTEVNMGYNGSEQFPEGKRFGFFPSFSLGWVASEESFFPQTQWLTFLKFRGSYGEVGNDKISNERYLYMDPPFTLGNGGYQAAVFGTPGIDMARYNMYKEGSPGVPDITWERAKKWNVGAELKLFKDKLSFSGDLFGEKRDNILWKLYSTPEYVIALPKAANIGKVENHGYELELGFKDKISKFNYWWRGAYSFARNKIIYQDEPAPAREWMRRTGQPIGQYFGLVYEGFYNTWEEINDPKRPKGWNDAALQPGDMKYRDLDSNGVIDDKDMGPIGYSSIPEITYSFSFGGSWKGFDFSVLLQGAAHVSVYFASSAAYPFTNQGWGPAHAWNLERWTPERYANGDKITFPRLQLNPGTQHNYQSSDFWVQNGSYVRLKNVELGYQFAAGVLRKIGVNSMRVYASGNNLITWNKMKYRIDPDARELWGRVYPPMRVYNAGFNFQF